MRGVHHDHVDAGVDQGAGPLVRLLADADRGGHPQPAGGVLGGVRVLLALGEVLDRDQPAQPAGVVDDRQLLHLVLAQQGQRVALCDTPTGAVTSGIGVMMSRTRVVRSVIEAHVAVGHDADQRAVGVGDRRAGDAVAAAQRVDVGQGVVGRAGDRVGDHAGLGPLHQVDLLGLLVDGEVAVQHADAALPGHRDRHARLGDGVHRAGHQRHRQRDAAWSAGSR